MNDPQICYPKPTDKAIYKGLVTQNQSLGVPFVSWSDVTAAGLAKSYDVVLDAMFGFSFSGIPRSPFDVILKVILLW